MGLGKPTTECPKGYGLVQRAGWDVDEDGKDIFRAVIVFPNGPPELNFDVIWQQRPVTIIEKT